MLYPSRQYLFLLAFLLILIIIPFHIVCSQEAHTFKIHSHNDYEQKIPFWNAYVNGLNSIEIDVFLISDTLYVAHHKNEIKKERTIERLYLLPLQSMVNLGLGDQRLLQILIDIKTDAKATLDQLIILLNLYPELISSPQISFVISGNRPDSKTYQSYPEFIQFDYQSLDDLPATAWDKVAIISLPFSRYSKWNGENQLATNDFEEISKVIAQAHAFKKPFRFWGTPDTRLAWKTFVDAGIDFINTDQPQECSQFLVDLN